MTQRPNAKRMTDLARMMDLAQSVCRIWRKTILGVALDRMSDNGSSFWSDMYGRQADKGWRCVYGIVEVCRGWWRWV